MIRQVETAINNVAERRSKLQAELDELVTEENEARDLLQLLKLNKDGTNAPLKVEARPIKQQKTTREDVMAILKDMPATFLVSELADALDLSRGQAAIWGHRMVQAHKLVYVHKAKPRDKNQTSYRKNF